MSPKYDPDYEPRLYDADGDVNKRWYIDFRIWDTDKQVFVRKQYTGMNKYPSKNKRRQKSLEKLIEIKELIKKGYTVGETPLEPVKPLEPELRFDLKTFTLKQAVIYFLNYKNAATIGNEEHNLVEKYNERMARVSKNTFRSYMNLKNMLFEWLQAEGQTKVLLAEFSPRLCDKFFTFLKEGRKIENKTYNKYRGYFSTVFNYFIQFQDLPVKNPLLKIEHLRVEESDMHMPFTNEQLQIIKLRIAEKGQHQLLLFISFIYYTFTRPGEEVRLLRVGDLHEKTIFIPSKRSKNNHGEHVAIPAGLAKLVDHYKLKNYPKHYYIFSKDGEPGLEPVGKDYFYGLHRRILNELNMEGYTMYGYKHTGAINLYLETKDILAVKNHCRHHSSTETDKYLRKYGMLLNEKTLLIKEF